MNIVRLELASQIFLFNAIFRVTIIYKDMFDYLPSESASTRLDLAMEGNPSGQADRHEKGAFPLKIINVKRTNKTCRV